MELLYVTVILSFGIVGTASKEISILGQIYDMQVVKTYEMQAPTVLEYRNQNIFMVIRNQAYSTGEDFTQLKMEQTTLRPTVEFTDKLGNIFQRRGRKATLTTEKSGVTTVSTGDFTYISQIQGDYARSIGFVISSPKSECKGNVYVFSTLNYEIVNRAIKTEPIKELGDKITALDINKSSGTILLSEEVATSNEISFKLISLRPITSQIEGNINATARAVKLPQSENNILKKDDNIKDVILTSVATMTVTPEQEIKASDETKPLIDTIKMNLTVTPAQEIKVLDETKLPIDVINHMRYADIETTLTDVSDSEKFKNAVEIFKENLIKLHENYANHSVEKTQRNNLRIRNRILSTRISLKRNENAYTPSKGNPLEGKFAKEIREAVDLMADSIMRLYSKNVFGKDKIGDEESCRSRLEILNRQIMTLLDFAMPKKRSDGAAIETILNVVTPYKAIYLEKINSSKSYTCGLADDFNDLQIKFDETKGFTTTATNHHAVSP